MNENLPIGLEQARATLPALVADAHAGKTSVITRHGKPVAALVPLALAEARRGHGGGLLALRGSGKGLWRRSGAWGIDELRAEWG